MALSSNPPNAEDGVDRQCGEGVGRCLIPFLIFISFFFNFIMADVGAVSDKYDTTITPMRMAFWIWVVIYVLEFAFVIYQLFYPVPRSSKLIQRKLALPFIFHQILTAAWLIVFSKEYIYAATGLLTVIWLLALLLFFFITREFRLGRYPDYSMIDYIFIEIPFATLLGWETLAVELMWNIIFIKLQYDGLLSEFAGTAAQIAAVVISFCVITGAAILFAGLPLLMDPFIHVPIAWGTFLIGWRWHSSENRNVTAEHLAWATPEYLAGISVVAFTVCGIVCIFGLVAAVILATSRFCLPEEQDEDLMNTEQPNQMRISPASTTTQRSPRTARSALSAERV